MEKKQNIKYITLNEEKEELKIPKNEQKEKLVKKWQNKNEKDFKSFNSSHETILEAAVIDAKQENKRKKISKSFTLEKDIAAELKNLADKNKLNESQLLNKILRRLLIKNES